MRCFIAIDIPDEMKETLASARNRFKDFNFREASEDSLHITLRFLGELDPLTAKKVQESLSLVKHPPFYCTLTEIGAFPSTSRARVVWAGLEKSQPFDELKQKIDMTIEHLVKNEDHASFVPHITLGRHENLPDIHKMDLELPKLAWNVTSFQLKQSILTPVGAAHTTLMRYLLEDHHET